MFSAFSYSPKAEKRDYEGVFCPCQISFHHFAKLCIHFCKERLPKKATQDREEPTSQTKELRLQYIFKAKPATIAQLLRHYSRLTSYD
jgi:hypothetical protein